MFGVLKTVPQIKRQEKELEAVESTILRFTLEGMRMDRIRNEQITGRELKRRAARLGVLGEDGAARKEEKEKIYRCGEGGHAGQEMRWAGSDGNRLSAVVTPNRERGGRTSH